MLLGARIIWRNKHFFKWIKGRRKILCKKIAKHQPPQNNSSFPFLWIFSTKIQMAAHSAQHHLAKIGTLLTLERGATGGGGGGGVLVDGWVSEGTLVFRRYRTVTNVAENLLLHKTRAQ